MNKSALDLINQSLEDVLERTVAISEQTLFRKDLGLGSIDIVDFILTLEKNIGHRIDIEDFLGAMVANPKEPDFSVGKVIAFVTPFLKKPD